MKRLLFIFSLACFATSVNAQSGYNANSMTSDQAANRIKALEGDNKRLENRVLTLEREVEQANAQALKLNDSVGNLAERLSSLESLNASQSARDSQPTRDMPTETTIVGDKSVTKYKSGKVSVSGPGAPITDAQRTKYRLNNN